MDKHRQEHPVRLRLGQPSERARLVRLCHQLTGDRETAEDLAQEALVEAWRNADKLRDPAAWQPWLSGIARNVYLRWSRRHGREMARRAPGFEGNAPGAPRLDESAAYDVDYLRLLERAEIENLLDQAMGALPAQTRDLLVARYVEDTPPAEIAARWGISENNAAVRLHRGKEALRRVLSTDLRAEAAAHGLIDPEAEAWQETRIWCPLCGEQRLQGRFVTRDGAPHFRVRCQGCKEHLGPDFSTAHRGLDAAALLSDIKGYKPALSRVSTWWHRHFQKGLAARRTTCGICGGPMPVLFTAPSDTPPILRAIRGIYLTCASCRGIGCFSAHGLTFGSPEVQQFWRRHARIRALPERDLTVEGRPAVAAGFESVTGRARIEVVLARDTFEVLRVEGAAGAETDADAAG